MAIGGAIVSTYGVFGAAIAGSSTTSLACFGGATGAQTFTTGALTYNTGALIITSYTGAEMELIEYE